MSFILRRIINVISTDMKMMVLEPGLRGGGGPGGGRELRESWFSLRCCSPRGTGLDAFLAGFKTSPPLRHKEKENRA